MATRVRIAETTKGLDQHVGYIKSVVARSLEDGDSRQLAVKIVSDSYDYAIDPRTQSEVPVVRSFGKNFYAPQGPTCPPRDELCEINRIWDFLVLNVRYVYDPAEIDTFATLKETLIAGGGDCFPEGTLLFTESGELKTIDDIVVGEKIWGRDRWSEVTQKVYKGNLPLTAIRLNNGDWLRLTEDHKVYVGICHRHAKRTEKSSPCSCPLVEREIVRMPVSELAPDTVLLQPGLIDTENQVLSEASSAVAELMGLYLADGWVDGSRICISGKDGHPKEAQKRRVVELAALLGLKTSWHTRYVRVYSQELVDWFVGLGKRAPQKGFNTLKPTLQIIPMLLAGLNADSGANTHGGGYTFSSTSRKLAIQTRILHRMQGTSCGLNRIDNHGGLGDNPIYRLTPRLSEKGSHKLLRVKEIERNLVCLPCYDISTDDHYVYLPEHDVTVSNCDDATIAFATLLGSIGFRVAARVISVPAAPDEWVHIYPMVGRTKDDLQEWMPLDITVDGMTPGWEYPDIAKHRDFLLV